ncbi:MAG TPA: M15 family metallopeptidase [Steroidobacteraceae bacterium]|nr:M15 family metallopeptidase [Steroidobacteraceae bacterium]
MRPEELTGRARSHIVDVADPPCALHAHVVTPFENLRRAARAEGFDLVAASSFRDFDRQLAIWNGKFNGTSPLTDSSGRTLDALALSPGERVEAILHWSALPGASRHHWGTDLDLIDRNAVAPGYRVQLTEQEFSEPGPFAPLAEWLETNAPRFGFFRPFRGILSGVGPEPWHYSFAPIAEGARRALHPTILRAALAAASLAGRDHVLARIEELHERYVASIDWP